MNEQLSDRNMFIILGIIRGFLGRYEYLDIHNTIFCLIVLGIYLYFRKKYLDNLYITVFGYGGSIFIFAIVAEWRLETLLVESIAYFLGTIPMYFYLRKKR